MSRVLENAYNEVQKSKFMFRDATHLEVQDAVIFWTNFSGAENQFGNRTRNFNLAVIPEVAAELERIGYRVRKDRVGNAINEFGEEVELYCYFINVKVNMESAYPPMVKLFTEYKGVKKQRLLDEETVGELDRINIRSCDCTIHSYTSKKFQNKVTGYLETLYVIQEPDIIFGGKYDDWDDPTVTSNELLGNIDNGDNY